MRHVWLPLLVVAALGAGPARTAPSPEHGRLTGCLVSLIDDVEVPALDAGKLTAVEAREGLEVAVDQLLARVDDEQPRHLHEIAKAEHAAAEAHAESDIKIKHAKAITAKASSEYQHALNLNKRSGGAVSATEERRLLLDYRAAELQVDQAAHERSVAQLGAKTKEAEIAAAQTAVERRKIRSPIAGMVVEVKKKQGEWVEPGETVVRVVRIDRLRVKGFLNSKHLSPDEVANRAVTVEVELARGRVEQFRGKIVFVNPLLEADGEYGVWAEVLNRADQGQWLLLPGMEATMQLHLDRPAVSNNELSRKPAERGAR